MLFVVFMRRVVVVGLWIIASDICLGSSAPEASEDSPAPKSESISWYVSAVVSGRSGYRVTHYWSRGSNLRAQTLIGIRPVTTIVRGDRYWVFDELLKQGIEIKRSPLAVAEDNKQSRPFANDLDDLIRANGEKVETGVLSGIRAETWRVTNSAGRRTVWVAEGELRVPLRVEKFDRETGETATLSYSNWTSGFDIPDSAFEPPADLRLEKFEYEQYVEKSFEGLVGPAPVLHPNLLHGPRSD